MKQSLATLAEELGCRLIGDGSITVERLSSLQSADAVSLIFVDHAKHFEAALASAAAAVIAGELRRAIGRGEKSSQTNPHLRTTAPHVRARR